MKKKEKVGFYSKKEGKFKRDCKKRAAEQKKHNTHKARMAELYPDQDGVSLMTDNMKDSGV